MSGRNEGVAVAGGVQATSARVQALARVRAIGPGIAFAVTVVGAGSVVSNAAAGATHGYSLLWVLACAVLFRFIWLEASARYVLVSGRTLIAGYASVHRALPWVVLIAIVVSGHLYNLYGVAVLGFTSQAVLPLPSAWGTQFWGLFWAGVGFTALMGGYARFETICRTFMVLMGVTLALVALLSKPEPVAIARGIFVPGLPAGEGFFATLLIVGALLGTEAGSLANITYSYFGLEKGWRGPSMLRPMRLDLLASAMAMFAMGALLQIAGAASLHTANLPFEAADDLLRIFSLRLGRAGELIFALGLWAATYSTFIGGTGGYAVVATDTLREIRQRPPATLWAGDPVVRRDPTYRLLVAFWAFSPLYALLLGWEPIGVALVVNVLVMLLIPVLAIALVRLTASSQTMGSFRNRLPTNIGLVLLILTSLYLIFSNGARWIRAVS